MKKASIAILVVLALLIGLVAGFYAAGMSKGVSVAGTNVGMEMKKGDYKDTFAEGWRAAKEKLEGSNLYAMNDEESKKMMSGTVKEISGNKILIDVPLPNPLYDESLKTRSVVADKAVLTVRKRRSQAEIEKNRAAGEKELASINAQIAAGENDLADCPPMTMATGNDVCAAKRENQKKLFMKMMEINSSMMNEYYDVSNPSLSDIKAGDYINIKADQNIRESVEFSAVQLDVTEGMSASAMMPAPGNMDAPSAETLPPAAADMN